MRTFPTGRRMELCSACTVTSRLTDSCRSRRGIPATSAATYASRIALRLAMNLFRTATFVSKASTKSCRFQWGKVRRRTLEQYKHNRPLRCKGCFESVVVSAHAMGTKGCPKAAAMGSADCSICAAMQWEHRAVDATAKSREAASGKATAGPALLPVMLLLGRSCRSAGAATVAGGTQASMVRIEPGGCAATEGTVPAGIIGRGQAYKPIGHIQHRGQQETHLSDRHSAQSKGSVVGTGGLAGCMLCASALPRSQTLSCTLLSTHVCPEYVTVIITYPLPILSPTPYLTILKNSALRFINTASTAPAHSFCNSSTHFNRIPQYIFYSSSMHILHFLVDASSTNPPRPRPQGV